MAKSVMFETKCYENDWEFVLKGSYLEKNLERCHFPFSHKRLIINNVKDIRKVARYAEKKVNAGLLDDFILAEDYAEEALKHFQIKKESFTSGYYYSISELVSIYLCEQDYLLHFSSDSAMEKNKVNWIDKAISQFEQNPKMIVANPVWNHRYQEAKNEAFDETKDWYIGYGFSDQCYLIRTDFFKGPVYNEKHPSSERYPKYGGELFEKRVDSLMRNREYYRITSKEVSYRHKNFPKKGVKRIYRKVLNFLA